MATFVPCECSPNPLSVNVMFVYRLLVVTPHSCVGVWSFGRLPAIVLLTPTRHCSESCFFRLLPALFNTDVHYVGQWEAGSSHCSVSAPLQLALQLACLLSALAHITFVMCGCSILKHLVCLVFCFFFRRHLRGQQSSPLGLGVF